MAIDWLKPFCCKADGIPSGTMKCFHSVGADFRQFLKANGIRTKFENWARFGIGGCVTEENLRQEEEPGGTSVGKDRDYWE